MNSNACGELEVQWIDTGNEDQSRLFPVGYWLQKLFGENSNIFIATTPWIYPGVGGLSPVSAASVKAE